MANNILVTYMYQIYKLWHGASQSAKAPYLLPVKDILQFKLELI